MDLEGSDSMEISYIKDGNRNTMIIKDIKIEKNDYKLQMVLNNHIEGLVQISVESINNETMLYYDISSKTQMSNMFTRKQMSGKELYIFIKDIKMQMCIRDRVMTLIPGFIIIYISVSSPEFLKIMYESIVGKIVMTVCLILYLLAYIWGERIVDSIMEELSLIHI